MNIDAPILISCISAVAAVTAVVFTYKNYKRQNTFENENHFFKYKIEQYQQLVTMAYKLLDVYQEIGEEGEYQLEHEGPSQSDLDELADEIDERTDEFRKSLNKFTLFMPQDILNKLEVFYDNLYNQVDKEEIDFKKIGKYIDPFHDELESIVNLMRKDIGIEVLNHKLSKRIKK